MNAVAKKRLDPNAAAHNAAIDSVIDWLRAYARKLGGQPVVGGVLADRMADDVRRLKKEI